MMSMKMRIRPSVCDVPGDFFRAVLTNSAFKSEKSQVDWEHIRSCLSLSAMSSIPVCKGEAGPPCAHSSPSSKDHHHES